MLRNILSKIILFIRKHPILNTVLAILIVVALFFIFRGNNSSAESFVEVNKGTITQEVNVTGKMQASSSVELAFERSGRITSVRAKVGDKVLAGQVLASIDISELVAQLIQAQADMQAQKSKLQELENGSRPEEIYIQETQFDSAGTALADARRDLIDSLNSSYIAADDAVHNKVDKFFSNPRSNNPTLNIVVYNPQLKTDIENSRQLVEYNFAPWKSLITPVTGNSDLKLASENVFPYLNEVKDLLNKLADAVNTLGVDSNKTDVSTARTNIVSATSNLLAVKEKLNTAEANYFVAARNLELKKAGNLPEVISAQEAQVNRADASIQLIQAQILKSSIAAPIGGLVTKQDAKTGEIASAYSPLVTLISESTMEIEANVPEVDMAKITIGNPAKITLDALPNETFSGSVTYIDPAETIIDGVVNFKIKVIIEKPDIRIKSGLTANLDIKTLSKDNVLTLPQYAIIENDNGTFVKRAIGDSSTALAKMTSSNTKTEEIPVTIGLISNDGTVEIISGLAESDKVLNVGIKSNK